MAQQAKRQKLTEGVVSKRLAGLAIPMMIGLFALISLGVVDTYFVSQLGTAPLAAMSFAFPITFIITSAAVGLGVGTATAVARHYGADETRQVQRLVRDGLLLASLFSAILLLFGYSTLDWVFVKLGAEEELLGLIKDYMRIWYLGTPLTVDGLIGLTVMRATGDSVTPSIFMSLAAILNMVLDPILIFGMFGLPRMELQGAAVATVVSSLFSFCGSLYLVGLRDKLVAWRWPTFARLGKSWRAILHVGLPSAATNLVNPICNAILVKFISAFGATAVAGFGVAARFEALALIACLALSACIGPFVGQNFGARRYDRMRDAMRISIAFCLFYGAGMAILLALFRSQIAQWFGADETTIPVVMLYFIIVPISYGANGIIMIVGAAYNALTQPRVNMLLYISKTFLLTIPLAWLGGQYFGLQGIFGAVAAGNLLVGFAAYWWFQRSFPQPASEALAAS